MKWLRDSKKWANEFETKLLAECLKYFLVSHLLKLSGAGGKFFRIFYLSEKFKFEENFQKKNK